MSLTSNVRRQSNSRWNMEVMQQKKILRIQPSTSRLPHKSDPQHSHSLTKFFTSSPAKAARACWHLQALQPGNQHAYASSHKSSSVEQSRSVAGVTPWRGLTCGSSRSLRSLGTAFRGPLTKRYVLKAVS